MDVRDKGMQDLMPFTDEVGVWRARRRLKNARDLPQEMRNPIVLSSNQNHEKLGHCGYQRALESSCKMVAYTEEKWRTFLADVTCLVNSRPLIPLKYRKQLWCSPTWTLRVSKPQILNKSIKLRWMNSGDAEWDTSPRVCLPEESGTKRDRILIRTSKWSYERPTIKLCPIVTRKELQQK